MSDLRYRTQVFFACKEDREKLQRVLQKMLEQGVIGEYSFAANISCLRSALKFQKDVHFVFANLA